MELEQCECGAWVAPKDKAYHEKRPKHILHEKKKVWAQIEARRHLHQYDHRCDVCNGWVGVRTWEQEWHLMTRRHRRATYR